MTLTDITWATGLYTRDHVHPAFVFFAGPAEVLAGLRKTLQPPQVGCDLLQGVQSYGRVLATGEPLPHWDIMPRNELFQP
jgi:hypothetical protein